MANPQCLPLRVLAEVIAKRLRRLSMVPKRCDIQYENHLADPIVAVPCNIRSLTASDVALALVESSSRQGGKMQRLFEKLKDIEEITSVARMMSHDES